MRRGPLGFACVALAVLGAVAVYLLRPPVAVVAVDDDLADAVEARPVAEALAAGGRAVATGSESFAGVPTGVLVGVVRRDGQPAAASVAVHTRRRPRPGHLLADVLDERVAVPSDATDLVPLVRADVGADGAFRLVVPAPATYVVVATAADGAHGRAVAGVVAPGAHASVVVALLRGTERLAGRAVHADGRPFQGSVVARRASEADDFLTVTPTPTDAEGRFTLEGLVPGPHVVTAFVPDRFAAHTRVVLVPHAGDLTIVVDAGLRPHPGRVGADADGKAVAAARVRVSVGAVLGLASVASVATTDGEGRFDVLVGSGSVEYAVDAAGFEPLRLSRSRPLDAPVELRLRRTARVSGRVTREPDGAPAPGIPVYARSDDGPLHGAAVTDAQGRYEIGAASPGPLTVFAHGGGWTTKGLSAWRPGDGFNPFEVTVDPDATVSVDLVVVRAGAAKGTVTDAKGAPVVGATIAAERIVPGGNSDAVVFLGAATAVATDDAGAFTMDALLLDASYRFQASVGRGVQGHAGPVRVEAGRVATVEIRMGPPRAGVVRCEMSDKAPLPGATIYAYQHREGRWDHLGTEVTAQDGAARVGPLPPGPIYLNAHCPGYRAEGEDSVTIGSDADDTSELAQTFVFKPSSSVAGVVRWAGGEPARGVTVHAKTERWNSSSWIDDDGTFSFEDVDEEGVDLRVLDDDGETELTALRAKGGDQAVVIALGKARPPAWRIRVVAADGRPVMFASLVAKGEGLVSSDSVIDGRAELPLPDVPVHVFVYGARGLGFAPLPCGWVVAGPFPAKADTAEIRLPPEKVIAGVVKDGAGRPVRGVALWARPKGLAEFGDLEEAVSWARTGADGRFRIGRLGAGLHTIRVSAPDSAGVMEPVEALAGKLDLEIVLATGREAPLTVLDAEGAPVEGAIVFVDRSNGPGIVVESDSAGVACPRGLDPQETYELSVSPPLARADCLPLKRKGWALGDSPVVLPRGLAIRGVVRDASGRAVPGASVERLDGAGDTAQRATSGRDGRFELTRVPDGPARLRARVVEAGLAGAAVATRAGAENLVLVVSPTVSLRVTIEGWPRLEAWLRLLDEDGGRGTPWSSISAEGVATVSGLRPGGTYRVYQTWEREGEPEVVVAKAGIRGDAEAVTIVAAEGQRIAGKVVLPVGVHRFAVLARRDGTTRDAATDDDGGFSVGGLLEGTWTVEAYAYVGDEDAWKVSVDLQAGVTGVVLDPKPPR